MLTFPLFAQQKQTRFYQIEAPISQNTITAIAQDKHGFIWVSTRYGLNKFDGVKHTTFHKDPNSGEGLPSDNINAMIADAEGNLIIGTHGYGFSYFDVDEQKFTSYRHDPKNPNSLSSNGVTCLFEDENGVLWIGTERGGLNVFDKKTNTFKRYFQSDSQSAVSFDNITAIQSDSKGNMIIGTRGQGLGILQKGNDEIIQLNTNNVPELATNIIKNIMRSDAGEIWLTTEKGIKKLHVDKQNNFSISNPFLGKDKLSVSLNNSDFLSIEECPKGVIWFGTENNGLFQYDTKKDEIEQFLQDNKILNSLPSNSIWSMHADRDNILWLGFYFKGLSKIDPLEQKFRPTFNFTDKNKVYDLDLVSSFAEDSDGTLWIGMDGNGLYRIKPDGSITYYNDNSGHNLESNNITDIELDAAGNLYVSTWGAGLKYLEAGKNYFTNLELILTESETSKLFNLILDSKDRLWVNNYQHGFEIIDTKTKKNLKFSSGGEKYLGSDKFHGIAEDQFGNIWLGSSNNGITRVSIDDQLNIVDLKSLQELSESTQLTECIISSIYAASDGKIWIGTRSKGLFYYDSKSLQTHLITDKVKLPSNNIYSINEDANGSIWAGTNKGLIRLNPKTLELDHFQKSDGLQSNEFFKNSSFKSKSGQLYFGGISGFNSFYTDEFILNVKKPKVYITDLEVAGKPQKIKGENYFNNSAMNFNHQDNDLTIKFSAINFSQSSKNIYKYRLEGYEENFQILQNSQEARYPNLSPGKYTFELMAANNDGVWSDEKVHMDIVIRKPWYLTYIAYFIYLIGIVSFFLWRRQQLIARQRLKYDLRLRKRDLDRMHEMDKIKTRFYTNISHELKTPVTLIISPLKNLITKFGERAENNKTYKLMLNNAENLHRLINQILEISKIEAGKSNFKPGKQNINTFIKNIGINFSGYADEKQIRYDIELPKTDQNIYFDPEKLERVFVNLISNAFKYTAKYGIVKISQTSKPNWHFIHIEDNGEGIKKEEQAYIFDRFYRSEKENHKTGTGIGLELAKQIVEQHKGYIKLESEPNIRTIFTVALKKGKSHFPSGLINDVDTSDFKFSEESVIELKNYQTKKSNNNINQPIPITQMSSTVDKPLILIVEDNPDLQEFLVHLFHKDYKVLKANNGLEGLELAKSKKPKLIITDAMMDQMDGFEMSKKIKEDPDLSHIMIIMATVKSSKESRDKAYQHGVDALMTKPFDPEVLLLRVSNFLKVKQNIKANIFNPSNLTANTADADDFIPFKEADERFIKEVVQVIETNLNKPDFTIEDLCKSIGVSKSNLYRKIKSILGCTTNELIRNTRIKKAAHLLKNSDLKISEITYRVGFNDLQYFRKCFKEVYKMTPSEFGKAAKQNKRKMSITKN